MLVKVIISAGIFLLLSGVRCELAEVLVEAGSQASLPCKCSRTPCHPAAITWSKDKTGTIWRKQSSGLQFWGSNWLEKGNQRVRCPHSKFAQGDYSLQINNVKEEDGGLYSCTVQIGDHFTDKHFVMLRIIQVSISPSAPVWGDIVSVTCSVTPWLNTAYMKWMLNNRPFLPESGSITNSHSSVVKESASDKLTGNWTCVINSKKKEWRATATLMVRGISQPSKSDTKMYAAVGSAFTLPCVFSPGLTVTRAVLEKTDVQKRPALSNKSPDSTSLDQSLTIQEVTLEDQGNYRCAATVRGHSLSRKMQLVVAQIVQSNKKSSVTLTCQLTDASKVIDYKWVHVTYDLNGTRSESSIVEGPTISLKDNWGEWTCRYYGKEGILGNITTQVQMMSGQSGKRSSAPGNTGTVIGLSFLLVILLLVLAQMYKNHQRRKRIFQYPALETIVHTVSNERDEKERNRVKE
ncbi:lymphocyte activation gene 3 protein [Kryptolebias marmoratus]|uniref:lymphocyte activation gene 3 protein n=1 Tax=Kryptolebias marmoratus TaxID=37003 RepID=UPI0007F8C081|nr:lymphocyte activation gene 3 protein [Kryptolebias marmoratus]